MDLQIIAGRHYRVQVEHLRHGCVGPGRGSDAVGVLERQLWSAVPVPQYELVKGAEIRVVNPAGAARPAGIPGDLQVRYSDGSRRMLNGYFHDPEATNAAFDGDWFRTGDIASIDTEGNVYFVGRSKDVTRRRGENVSAFEVEEALLAHPDVSECAAVSVPSELTEDDLKVVVVPRSGSTRTAREVYEFARKTMPRFQVPRYIELATSLPHTPTGKVEKFRLAENWRSAQTVDFDFDLH
jgi:carnitine-CoA ligase